MAFTLENKVYEYFQFTAKRFIWYSYSKEPTLTTCGPIHL